MFWRFGGYANISTIDSILDKPDVTVEELLDEADLIQELKQQNSKLVEFLRDDNVLERLLQYVVAPKGSQDEASPDVEERDSGGGGVGALGWLGSKRRAGSKSISKDTDEESKEEKQRLKYAYVACEILSSDVWSLAEALLENHDSLRKFWDYLKQDDPLDSVQAGYFTKVNESLLDKKPEEMLDFFKTLDKVIPNMLRHVDCPSIMDLLLKIISLERQEGGQGIVDWLQAQNLIPLLLSHLSADHSTSTQTSAGDFIKAIITISANATAQDANVIGPNELTRQLVSQSCVQNLIREMLKGGNPLTVGVGIVIEVIRKNNSDYDVENAQGPIPKSSDPIYLGTLLRQFALNIPKFMDLIQGIGPGLKNGSVPTRRELKVAFGNTIEPLGFDRFKTCELMAELLHCSNMALLNERGAEAEIKKRDEDRERLKSEGKLASATAEDESTLHFGTSVDSQGFHHARPPSISDSPEEIKRPELSISAEEEFENVNAADALGEEMKNDFDETEPGGEMTSEQKRNSIEGTQTDNETLAESETSSGSTILEENAMLNQAFKASTVDTAADSPTSAGLTERLGSVELDPDTLMPDATGDEHQPAAKDPPPTAPQDTGKASGDRHDFSSHPEDTPAPLFSGLKSPTKSNAEAAAEASPEHADLKLEQRPTSKAGDGESGSVFLNEDNNSPFTVDIDGTPVVGDLLKIMFVEHKVVPTILDFFFRFPWNNFLHNVVYDVVQQVFNGPMERGYNRVLAIDLFETGRITNRIVEGQRASDKSQQEQNMRLGYMGHLTLIAEEVVKFTERHPPELLSQSVLDKVMSQDWIDYVEQTLAETRERDNAILGGVRPDVSVGPRQAVLNAVNAAHAFPGSSGLSGLTGNGALGLDTADLTSAGGGASGGYLFSGSSLLSGFNHGSSDEEDEDMGDDGDGRTHQPFSAEDQPSEPTAEDSTDHSEDSESRSQPINIPPPLKFHPTRARRQFAARLAERHRALQGAQEAEAKPPEDDGPSAASAGTLHAPLQSQRMSPAEEGATADNGTKNEDDPRSDDSVESEDVGILMRKSVRAAAGGAASSSAGGGSSSGLGLFQLGLGRLGLGSPREPDEGAEGRVMESSELSDVFERLGIDVDVEGDIESDNIVRS